MTKPKKPVDAPIVESAEALEELRSDLQRVQADFVNFRRRIEGERGELLQAAKISVIAQITPLFDNLDRAISHIPPELADNTWAVGVAQVAKQVSDTLGSLGVSTYGEAGEEFDPALHEAIAHEGSGDHIVEVLQRGYRIDERVIRPAIVKVGHVKKGDK